MKAADFDNKCLRCTYLYMHDTKPELDWCLSHHARLSVIESCDRDLIRRRAHAKVTQYVPTQPHTEVQVVVVKMYEEKHGKMGTPRTEAPSTTG